MLPIAAASAEVVLPCEDLDATLDFFTDRLGFRLDTVRPADDPTVAVVSGHGVRLRLVRGDDGPRGRLRLIARDPGAPTEQLVAPNGTLVEIVADDQLVVPPPQPTFDVTRLRDGTDGANGGGVGRAGMHYRDLLPSRQGGRFIASHIAIPDGGAVPDYVHYHRIRFQVIYCLRGWVRVVYEDQGGPFLLEAGDCVLQPPGIRHRVLEASAGLEVIEVTCPADHPTHTDHDLTLPTSHVRSDRDFAGQRFVRHRAAGARWEPWRWPGFETRDTGVGAATDGLAGVRVIRPVAPGASTPMSHHDAELVFWYVIGGTAALRLRDAVDEPLEPDDAVAVPAGLDHALTRCSPDLELLEVTLPERPAQDSPQVT